MAEYLYTLQLKFTALDDVAARTEIFNEDFENKLIACGTKKLQEIYLDKPPRKVDITNTTVLSSSG